MTGSLKLAVAAGLATTALVAHAAPLPPAITKAAADPARGDQARQDVRRRGPEILAFAGVRPGDKVIDLIPGAAYWTRLFARVVGPKGHVYGIWPEPYAKLAGRDTMFYGQLAKNGYPNTSLVIQPATKLSAPEKIDLVFTAQNYHDYPDKFMGSLDPSVLNKAVYAALKPGGTFLVIDHQAAPGSGMRDTDTLHRIEGAAVIKQVTAAGFRFVGSSKLLANSTDDHSKAVFDKSIRGRTDQFIYKFRKPG